MKRIISVLLTGMIVVSLFSVSFNVSAKTKNYVKSIKVTKSKLSVYENEKKTIKAQVKVSGKASKKIAVTVSPKKKVKISVGKTSKTGITAIKIKGYSAGKAKIKIKAKGKNIRKKYFVKYVTVTVKENPDNEEEITITPETTEPSTPAATEAPTVPSIPAPTEPTVAPTEAPTAAPTEAPKPTEPEKIHPQSVSIDNPNPNILNNGESIQLKATVSPSNTTDKTITWTSSNEGVATVDKNGLVKALSAGTAIVTAMSTNAEIKASATIRVNQTKNYIGNGTYCFKLKGTNMYVDHQGGSANGTNVLLWEGDGKSNKNQKIKLERIDDNRNKLWSAVSDRMMIDVNRGNSYSDPLKIGLNIDLWENNDWQAQEWLFTKTYDGYYIIRLNMLKEGAIEAAGRSNGSNIFYGTYNPENDMQKWEIVGTPNYEPVKRNGKVVNTESVGNVNVRSGPGTNYPSIGGFNEGQIITVIGEKEGSWYKVKGTNRHDGATIEGYSHADYIQVPIQDEPISNPDDPLQQKFNELKKRFVNGQYWNHYNSSDYSHTGTIPCKCSGTCSGYCSCECGQFYFNGRWVAGQCHGYALRLAYEIYGSNANGWAKNTSINDVRPGDIIRFWGDGHSVMVTGVSGNNITFTDCNRAGPCKVAWDVTWNKSQFTNLTCIYKHP